MESLQYFKHAVRQVTGNLGVALRMSALLYAIYVMLTLVPLLMGVDLAGNAFQVEAPSAPVDGDGQLVLVMFASAVFQIWLWGLIAVVWHRFVLIEEPPAGIIPLRPGLPIWAYIWQAIKITLIIFIPLLIVLVIVVAGLFGGNIALVQSPLVLLVIGTLFMTALLRLGITLPDIALARTPVLTISQAWDKTRPYVGVIMGIALISVSINLIVPMGLLAMLQNEMMPYGVFLVIKLLFDWFFLLVNVSVLTTLYGRIVQNRPIF